MNIDPKAFDLTDEQRAMCEENGYVLPRLINGQLCALHQYVYTVGLVVDITEISYERRYCYENAVDAMRAFAEYENVDEHAPGPWIKCKGRYRGEAIDLLNPELK